MHLIGYWITSLADTRYFPPQELVGNLAEQVRAQVADYLDAGSVFRQYRGLSWCRFCCGRQPAAMGSRELTDGQWVWPEALSHYVRDHAVLLPEPFIGHVQSGGSKASRPVQEETPDDELWIRWCQARSTGHLQVAIASAHRSADIRAEERRKAHWEKRERDWGLSDINCLRQGCPSRALQGQALCARHAGGVGYDPGFLAYHEGLRQLLDGRTGTDPA